jgi:hypothetical protein
MAMSGIFASFKAVIITVNSAVVNSAATINNVALASNLASQALPVHATVLRAESLTEALKSIKELEASNASMAAKLTADIDKLLAA